MGVVMSSPGYALPISTQGEADTIDWSSYGSMNILSWLTFWRFVSGVGLGTWVELLTLPLRAFSTYTQ